VLLAFSAGLLGAFLFLSFKQSILNKVSLLRYGLLLFSLGCGLFCLAGQSDTLNYFILVFMITGLGATCGMIESLVNVLLLDWHPHQKILISNWGQAFFALGAILGPPLSGILKSGMNWGMIFGAISLAALALWSGYRGRMHGKTQAPPPRIVQNLFKTLRSPSHPLRLLLKDSFYCFLCIAMILYVGVEVGWSFWVGEYLETERMNLKNMASGVLSLFWLTIMAGRYAFPFLAKKYSVKGLLVFSGLLSLSALLPLWIGTSAAALVWGTALWGLGLSAMFGTIVALAAERFPEQQTLAVNILLICLSLGGFGLPPLIGILARSPFLSLGTSIAAVCGFSMLIITWIFYRKL